MALLSSHGMVSANPFVASRQAAPQREPPSSGRTRARNVTRRRGSGGALGAGSGRGTGKYSTRNRSAGDLDVGAGIFAIEPTKGWGL